MLEIAHRQSVTRGEIVVPPPLVRRADQPLIQREIELNTYESNQ